MLTVHYTCTLDNYLYYSIGAVLIDVCGCISLVENRHAQRLYNVMVISSS